MTKTGIQKVVATTGIALALSLAACGSAGTDGTTTDDVTKDTNITTTADGTKKDEMAESDKTDEKDKKSNKKDDNADSKKDSSKDSKKDSDKTKKSSDVGYLDEPINNGYSSGKHEATIKVKDYGTIKLELDADKAPITVSNFAELANNKFYDGLTFHRIIKDFMIQGGDPLGNGTGGSDQEIKGEFESNGVDNDIKHERGTISMARSADPNSASSQFFICDSDDDFLNGEYASFGHVTKGMDVVDAIAKAGNKAAIDGNGTVPSDKQPVIKSIRVK